MRFPQEVVVQTFLPTYRALLAEALSEHDLAQATVARLVGVTQAQVSKYLAGKVDREPAIVEDPRVQATVARVASALAGGEMDEVDALGESLALIRRLQNRGPLA
ncbi:MAG: transcriptional regulator, partial [Candidatus Thermoplasmatota archaeon]|nr:transcriptional regulator [Candidatus Thermoplasmatota archaeon]